MAAHVTTKHGTTKHVTTKHGTTKHGTTKHVTTKHGTTKHGTKPGVVMPPEQWSSFNRERSIAEASRQLHTPTAFISRKGAVIITG
jgi:hypothetical protein